MLLIGIWISLTKNPMKPIMQKPMAVAIAIFWNSFLSGFVHRLTRRILSFVNWRPGSVSFFIWSIVLVKVVFDWRTLRKVFDVRKLCSSRFEALRGHCCKTSLPDHWRWKQGVAHGANACHFNSYEKVDSL